MNGMTRFLSRREKNHEKRPAKHTRSKSNTVPADYYAIFSKDLPKPSDKEDDKKVKALVQRLQAAGINTLGDQQAYYALSLHPDDLNKAYEVLLLANDAFDGVITDFDPAVRMLGAVNRNMTTCYLDALLFAMFARLDSFEAMLYDNFADEPRKKLAAILRLWVGFLRTGRLIGIDFTKHLQEALAKCGWEEAAEVCQQDASEAFTFITGALELPLLTLKMDIYHTGREDKEDDHKFVNERLLEVALPEQPEEGKTITLEDCLESYFNNRIEVKRYLQRQNTTDSIRSGEKGSEKNLTVHIETVEVPESSTPIVETPTSLPPTPPVPSRPVGGRRRADSIFSERYRKSHPWMDSSEKDAFDEKRHLDEMWNSSGGGRPRAASLRKEVLMPAWQFFSLIPWYTDNVPQTDAQVAAHFSSKRPVLGICLKRYQMLPDGTPKRLNTFIDIPLEIGLPHFVSDDRPDDVGPLFGNFKLVLQSVVCHRGVRVDSGHYISLVRANKSTHEGKAGTHPKDSKDPSEPSSSDPEIEIADEWLLFDDLARDRVREIDIKQALQDESPYLLFYQVQPIDEELASRGDPPSYSESQFGTVEPSKETLHLPVISRTSTSSPPSENGTGEWENITHTDITPNPATDDQPIGQPRSSMSSNRRGSITFDLEHSGSLGSAGTFPESISRGRTAPPTPIEDTKLEESKGGFLSASRRGSKQFMSGMTGGLTGSKDKDSGNKSRPSSQSGENRLSLTLSRLTGRVSKDRLVAPKETSAEEQISRSGSAAESGGYAANGGYGGNKQDSGNNSVVAQGVAASGSQTGAGTPADSGYEVSTLGQGAYAGSGLGKEGEAGAPTITGDESTGTGPATGSASFNIAVSSSGLSSKSSSTGLGRSRSLWDKGKDRKEEKDKDKEEKKDKKEKGSKLRSKSKDPRGAGVGEGDEGKEEGHYHHGRHKNRPDRECVVM